MDLRWTRDGHTFSAVLEGEANWPLVVRIVHDQFGSFCTWTVDDVSGETPYLGLAKLAAENAALRLDRQFTRQLQDASSYDPTPRYDERAIHSDRFRPDYY